MDILRNYIFEFKKYPLGTHVFYLKPQKNLFSKYKNKKINYANLKVKGTADIQNNQVIIELKIIGFLNLACDICNEFFDYYIKRKITLIYKITDHPLENENEIFYISPETTQINLKKLIYEYVLLSLPIKIVHPLDSNGNRTCNPEVLKILENHENNFFKNQIKGLDNLKNLFNN